MRSENPDVKAGDHLYGFYRALTPRACARLCPATDSGTARAAFQQYTIQKNAKAFHKVESKPNVPWSAYVGICGMPGTHEHNGLRRSATDWCLRGDRVLRLEGVRQSPEGELLGHIISLGHLTNCSISLG